MTTLVEHDGFRFLVRDESETGPTMPIRMPKTRNWFAVAGDGVVAAVRWFGRVAMRFSDWVDRNVVAIVSVFTALSVLLAVCVLLLLYGQEIWAITVGMVGVVVVTGVVAYRAGAKS